MVRLTPTLLALVIVTSATTTVQPPPPPGSYDAHADDTRFQFSAKWASHAAEAADSIAEAHRLVEYAHMTECVADGSFEGVCYPGSSAAEMQIRACLDGDPIPPLWRRTRASTFHNWGPWQIVLNWTCPEDYAAIPTFTLEDFRRLSLAPPQLNVQPARAEHLVNMPAIVYTTPSTQTFTTDLLGYTFEVQATPTSYTWDFGDGTVITTTDPGTPYPHHTISHPYRALGDFTITLTTEWSGRYHLAGEADWRDVVGTATTSASTTITTVESRTHLVGADCNQDPHGPWCEG